jgi:hypothetical protein
MMEAWVGGGDKQRVRARYDLPGQFIQRCGGMNRAGAFDVPVFDLTGLYVFWAIPKALLYAYQKAVIVKALDDAVHAIAAARMLL